MSAAALASGRVGEYMARFPSALREQGDTRPVTAVTLTIPVAPDDLEAVFWWLIGTGVTLDELTDPDVAVFYLCEALAHEDTHTFAAARAAITGLQPGTRDQRVYQWVRELVADLIGPIPACVAAGPARALPDPELVMA